MTEPVDLTGDEVVAKPANYYRNARFIVVLMMLGFGLACIYHGFVTYPKENQVAIDNALAKAGSDSEKELTEEQKADIIKDCKAKPKNSGMSIMLNRVMGFLLPPGGIALLVRTIYRSRGVIRLKGETLEVPGHRAIPLDDIRRIDQTLWERKGIAYIEYELADGTKGRACLDDFIHNDLAVKEIMTRIEIFVKKKIEPEGSGPIQV